MMFKSIRTRLALSFAGIALVAALALGAVLLTILRDYYSNQELNYLHINAQSVGTVLSAMMSAHAPHDEMQSQVESLAFLTLTRIRLYSPDGQVLYDSGSPQNLKVNLGVVDHTFIQSSDALPKDKIFISVGGSPNGELPFPETVSRPVPEGLTSKNVFVYQSNGAGGSAYGFALRLPGEAPPVTARSKLQITEIMRNPKTNDEIGSVQLSEGPAYGNAILTSVGRGWAISSAIAVLLAALIGRYISRRISAPVLALSDVTARMTQGDLSSRADVKGRDEFGQLARSFNEMASRVEETVRTLRAFVADAAHELHTPLTALQTNLELARDEKNTLARNRYLERVQEQSQRLEALVKSLLDLSRIEAAEFKFDLAPIDFSQLVREVSEQFASRAEQTDHEFEAGAIAKNVSVIGNSERLRQVMINLLENALKFTPGTGLISVALEAVDDQAELTITDTGIGIPPDDLPHLFERFHRGRNASNYAGNGLGLAIVKAIVAAHKGEVLVQSEVGKGTQVIVSIPIYKED
jgi:signal transduction histidine kinase